MIKSRLTASRVLFNVVNYLFFAVLIFLCLFPIWYVFAYSISGNDAVAAGRVTFYPIDVTLRNYVEVFQIKGVFGAFLISVLRTVIGAGLTLVACTLLGYLFSKKEMPMRAFLYRALIITMYVSGGLIPSYLTIRAYGLLGSFWVYILPSMVNAYYVILVKTYIEQLPESLEESARIDGAGTVTVFVRIIFPLSVPIVATIGVYAAVGQWNAWFDNHIYTFMNNRLTTLQYMLYIYLNQVEQLIKQIEESATADRSVIADLISPKGVRMTITILTVLPILFVYPFMQRYFIKGIMLGAVKG